MEDQTQEVPGGRGQTIGLKIKKKIKKLGHLWGFIVILEDSILCSFLDFGRNYRLHHA